MPKPRYNAKPDPPPKTRVRRNGEGSIRERPDGLFEARISLPPDSSGKAQSMSQYAKNYDEASLKLAGT